MPSFFFTILLPKGFKYTDACIVYLCGLKLYERWPGAMGTGAVEENLVRETSLIPINTFE